MNFFVEYFRLIDLLALAALVALACAALVLRGGNSGGNLGRDANHKFALSWSRQAKRR